MGQRLWRTGSRDLPPLFQVFKPERRLKPGDHYQSKPTIASELVRQLVRADFRIRFVLADALYGESGPFIQTLDDLGLSYVVAIRDNHGVLMLPGRRIRYTRWLRYERTFSDGSSEPRYMREVVYGHRRRVRYFQLTSDPDQLPAATTRFVMTNLTGNLRHTLGNCYGLRTWIEYGFKHIKHELGWTDYRLTAYHDIERWWELVASAYLMVSLQAPVLALPSSTPVEQDDPSPVLQHPWWHPDSGWKHILNNLRLLIQPFCAACLFLPWLSVFPVPGLIERLHYLITCINGST